MCYEHALVPVHNEDSDFFQGFPQSLQLFQFSLFNQVSENRDNKFHMPPPPLRKSSWFCAVTTLGSELALLATLYLHEKHVPAFPYFCGHFPWQRRFTLLPRSSKHVWTGFPSPRVSRRCKYIIMSSHCLSLISSDLAGVKQTWHNLVTLQGAKGHNFNYNPHYLLRLSESVNTKAQVV